MRKGSVFTVLGLMLIVAALGLSGYNLWDASRADAEADAALEQLLPQISEPVAMPENVSDPEAEFPDYVLNPEMDMPVQTIVERDYIGVLSIPSLGRELPIISDWSYPDLKVSPCRYSGSVYQNDLVIAAHNYRNHFGRLRDLRLGDAVTFTDLDGNVFRYEVAEIETLQPTAVKEMTSGDWDLTLFTCTVGGAARVTVRCALAE